MKAVNAVSNYLRASFEELTRVTWPTKQQAVKISIIVLIFCLVAAVVLGAVDYLFGQLYSYLVNLKF
ncbi:preprotein translocase subunit SecE [Candidatus Peregrinibacteria bacterium]|nr:preprotein translocase subunit SecE [Candidatus Peregrinibacteria bacterium]